MYINIILALQMLALTFLESLLLYASFDVFLALIFQIAVHHAVL
jgi:hypothetical protein